MAWEISHAPAAWDAARKNLEAWTDESLKAALTDDVFEAAEESEEDAEDAAQDFRLNLDRVPHDTLVDMTMHKIEQHMTCDNGGFNFWIDRKGYHKVSCGTEEEAKW